MVQVNVTYDDTLFDHLDALAQEQGLSRPDLLRAIAEEAVKAGEQGRELFEPPPKPVDVESALTLASKVDALCVDLDRTLRSADRREGRLLDRFNATEAANREAVDRLDERMLERFAEGVTPFAQLLEAHHASVERLHERMLKAAREHEGLSEIDTRLKLIADKFQSVGPTYNVHLFDQVAMSWKVLAGFAWGTVLLSMFVVTLFARVLPDPWLATPLAKRLYGSSEAAICGLYRGSRGATRSCAELLALADDRGEP